MSNLRRETVTITTDASGDGTGYTGTVTGTIRSIRYVKTDYATGVDMTITGETTGIAIVTLTNYDASGTVYPRAATHDTTGAASLYAAGGTAVNDHIPVVNERVKIVVAQGGNAKTGTFYVTVGT